MDEIHAIPLIKIFGNLIVSIQISLSDRIVEQLISDVTRAVEEGGVSAIIVDFSGVELGRYRAP